MSRLKLSFSACVCRFGRRACVCVCSTALDEQAWVARRQEGALHQGAISSHQKHHTPPKRISRVGEREEGRRAHAYMHVCVCVCVCVCVKQRAQDSHEKGNKRTGHHLMLWLLLT
jgi:hypothetical protein